MRTLYESLLDDEDELVDRADDVITAEKIKDPKSEFRHFFKFVNLKSIEYKGGVLEIDAENTHILPNIERISKYCPGIKTLKVSGALRIECREWDNNILCDNIEAKRIFSGIYTFVKYIKNINFKALEQLTVQATEMYDCNVETDKLVFHDGLPKIQNLTGECDYVRVYDCCLMEDGQFAECFDSALDHKYSYDIYDSAKKSLVNFNPNKLKKIVAKIRNPKRYSTPDFNKLYSYDDLYKFKNEKNIMKVFNLDKLKFNFAAFDSNDLGFKYDKKNPYTPILKPYLR